MFDATNLATNSDSERNPRADGKHKTERRENRHNAGKELRKAHQKTVGKLVHVGNDAAEKVAVGVTVDVF